MLRFDPAEGAVDLYLGTEPLCRLRSSQPDETGWRQLLAVRVEDNEGNAGSPPMLGQYALEDRRVRFRPRFPFVPGVRYRATASPSVISDETMPATLAFSLAALPLSAPAKVIGIFPSAAVLPENLLRFYVHFSAPMQRGTASTAIALCRSDGASLPATFLSLATELWDPTMRRLTLILHPGRIKRGVGSDTYAAPVLRQGEHYKLTVGAAMHDQTGRKLSRDFVKSFRVVKARRHAIEPDRWSMVAPPAGTRQPLALRFPAPLDRALLAWAIHVSSPEGIPLPGRVAIDRSERSWRFTPSAAWQAIPHRLNIAADLEDICGNRVAAAFDAPPQQDRASHPATLCFAPSHR